MDGNIYILGLTDGKKLWSFNAGTPISSSPAVIKGKFYILTEDGRLLALRKKVKTEYIISTLVHEFTEARMHRIRRIIYENCISDNRFRRIILLW